MPRPLNNDDLPELEDVLPPMDGDRDDEEPPETEFEIGIDSPAGEQIGLDDEVAADLEVGIDIEEPTDVSSDEPGELVLDIAELLDRAEEREDDDDAGAGPADFDPSIGIDDLPDAPPEGGEEGIEEPPEAFAEEELPELDGDDDADIEPATLELDAVPDEELPATSEWPWAEHALIQRVDPCVALDVADNGIVAATSEQLLWIIGDSVQRIAADTSRVHSLCRIGREGVLYATVTGELVRRASPSSAAERLPHWRRAAGLAPDDPAALELCRLGARDGGVLAKTSAGGLLVSDDAGDSFALVPLEGKVKALPAAAEACVVLVRGGAAPYLLSSRDAGRSFRRVELDATARRVAAGDATSLAAAGALVVLADAVQGVCVSSDEGRHFVRAPGCGGATAVAIGRSGGSWLVVAALYREVADVAYLVMIDPATGATERVGELVAASSADGFEAGRIASLCFEDGAPRLWAAGGFGITSWSPERLTN